VLPEEYFPWDISQVSRVDELFDKIDLNQDGELSFEEFKAAIQSESYLMWPQQLFNRGANVRRRE
ncbi:hypothetical protein CBR_g10945, partial [Chara braunii]